MPFFSFVPGNYSTWIGRRSKPLPALIHNSSSSYKTHTHQRPTTHDLPCRRVWAVSHSPHSRPFMMPVPAFVPTTFRSSTVFVAWPRRGGMGSMTMSPSMWRSMSTLNKWRWVIFVCVCVCVLYQGDPRDCARVCSSRDDSRDSLPQNGDLNWIIQDKILAFAGPSYERHVSPEGYCTLAPSDYIPYFTRKQVKLVIRLNKKCYNEQDFIKAGIDHCDAFFLDGSCPPTKILQRVLAAMEALPEQAAVAIHCKAGLGRTGTCIGAYLMKHYRFTAAEAIGWMRVCRPGMVIGPQQHFLHQIEHAMWQEGDMAGVVKPLSMAVSSDASRGDEDMDRAGLEQDEEAVKGRQGQAAGLLAARGRRQLHPIESVESESAEPPASQDSAATATPAMTAKDSPVPVTPETTSALPQLWCGGGLV